MLEYRLLSGVPQQFRNATLLAMKNHLRRCSLTVLLCTVLPIQTSFTANQKPSKPVQPKRDPELEQRRATAMSLMQSLAIEARSYRDEPLRARVQARIADVIWNRDQEAARALFRRAWEVAEAVDQAQTNQPQRRSPTGRTPLRTNLRREILQLVSRRDHKLGEEFIAKLTPADPNQSTSNPETSAAESAERLRLANQFLADGNVERALQFADPALQRISERSILFLVELREKNALAANQRFASLLSIAGADPHSDANTVSLLTSFSFTPSVFLVVSPTGIPSSNNYQPRRQPDLAPLLRRQFFEVAAGILLRPLPQIDGSSAGRQGTQLIITRLMPLFDQFAPDLAATLKAQLTAIRNEAPSAYAVPALELNPGMNGDGYDVDGELKEALDRAQGADERDRAYALAALNAANRVDPRARDFADKIEDSDTRKGIIRFVDYFFIRTLIRRKQANEAATLIRRSDLTHTWRAHYLTQVATLILKEDRVRAVELFDQALTETRRIDAGTPERAYSLTALLRQFATIDRARTWELLSETIKAANGVSDFTGENGLTAQTLEGKFGIRMSTEIAAPTDLSEAFEALAAESFYQALDVGKTFTGDAPRALAMIAIARAVAGREITPKMSSQSCFSLCNSQCSLCLCG